MTPCSSSRIHLKNEKRVTKMPLIRSEMFKNILNLFNKEGIEILSPRYVAYREGNFSTIPSENDRDIRNPIEKAIDVVTGKNTPTKDSPETSTRDKE